MRKKIRVILILAGTIALGGCAIDDRRDWPRQEPPAHPPLGPHRIFPGYYDVPLWCDDRDDDRDRK